MLARPCVILSAKFRCACTGVPRDAVHFKALLELHTLLPFRFLRKFIAAFKAENRDCVDKKSTFLPVTVDFTSAQISSV